MSVVTNDVCFVDISTSRFTCEKMKYCVAYALSVFVRSISGKAWNCRRFILAMSIFHLTSTMLGKEDASLSWVSTVKVDAHT